MKYPSINIKQTHILNTNSQHPNHNIGSISSSPQLKTSFIQFKDPTSEYQNSKVMSVGGIILFANP